MSYREYELAHKDIDKKIRAERQRELSKYAPELFSLDEKGLQHFREKVESNNGTIYSVIHPFNARMDNAGFGPPEEHYLTDTYHKNNPRVRMVEDNLKKMIAEPTKNKMPIIIFDSDVESTREILSEILSQSQDTVYFIRTETGTPAPEIIKDSNLRESERREKSWDILAEKLTSLGVKKSLVGGLYLVLLQPERKIGYDEWETDGDPLLAYCVAGASQALESRGFQTEITLAHPATDEEVKKAMELKKSRTGSK